MIKVLQDPQQMRPAALEQLQDTNCQWSPDVLTFEVDNSGKYERNVNKVQLTTNQCNHNLQGPVMTSAHLQTNAG